MTYTKQLLGISLAIVMVLGSVPFGFSEPLKVQLENGIETDELQCDNDSHVFVLRTNGNYACVSEKTALKTGWEIINVKHETNDTSLDEFNGELLVIEGVEPMQGGYVNALSPSDYPVLFTAPSNVQIGEEFNVDLSWQFFNIDKIGFEKASNDDRYKDIVTEDDFKTVASETHSFAWGQKKVILASVTIPANADFVNYKESGFIVIDESVLYGYHTLTYHKLYDYTEDSIYNETFTLKLNQIPSADIDETLLFGIPIGGGIGIFIHPNSDGTVSLDDEQTYFYEMWGDEEHKKDDCDSKCRYYLDNTKPNIDIQNEIIQKYVELTNYKTTTKEYFLPTLFFNYYHNNDNSTFKDYLQSQNLPVVANEQSSSAVMNPSLIDGIVADIEEEKSQVISTTDDLGYPLDVDFMALIIGDTMFELGKYSELSLENKTSIIDTYELPDWFVTELLEKYPELADTYNLSESFVTDLLEKYPEIIAQSMGQVMNFFLHSLDWNIPEAYGDSSVVTVYGNIYDKTNRAYMSDIKICIADAPHFFRDMTILKNDSGEDACTTQLSSIGGFTLSSVLSSDPDNDGTTADYIPVIFYENEKKVKIIDWKKQKPANQYDTKNTKNNGGSSGYVGLGVVNFEKNTADKYYELFTLMNDIYDTGKSYKSGLDKINLYYTADSICKTDKYGYYRDDMSGSTCGSEQGRTPSTFPTQGEPSIYLDYRLYNAIPVISHEYGHFIHDEIGEDGLGSLNHNKDPNNPCKADRNKDSTCNDDIFREAFAEYFALVYNESPVLDFTSVDQSLGSSFFFDDFLDIPEYLDYEDREYKLPNESPQSFISTTNTSREDVTSAFWDISDSTNETDSSDTDKKDDLTKGYRNVIDEIDTYASIYAFQTNWEANYEPLSHIFYLNDVDNKFQGANSDPNVLKQNWKVSLSSSQHNQKTDETITVSLIRNDVLDFDYIISSEARFDFGRIYINDVEKFKISGDKTDTFSYTIPTTGSYTLKIEYKKDGSVSTGNDSFEIVKLTRIPATTSGGGGSSDNTPPVITITSPLSNQGFTIDDITVSGSASDSSGIKKISITPPIGVAHIINNSPSFSHTFTGLGEGLKTFNIYAWDNNNNRSTKSVSINIHFPVFPLVPITPTTSTNTNSYGSVTLVWHESTDVISGFEILRSTSPYISIANVTSATTTYTDNNVEPETTYNYKIRAHNNDGYTDSEPITVTTVSEPDTTAPTLTIPTDKTFEATAINTPLNSTQIGTATATDDTDNNPIITNNSTGIFPLGDTAIFYNATDSSGNSATGTQTVTIQDTTSPTITAPGNTAKEATALLTPVTLGNYTASDIFLDKVINNSTDAYLLGDTIVLFTANDTSNNISTDITTITIQDTTSPIITVPNNVTLEATAIKTTYTVSSATATDIFSVTITNDAPDSFDLGDTTITHTATDSNGNISTGTQIITIQDTTSPITIAPDDIIVEATGVMTSVDFGDPQVSDIFYHESDDDHGGDFPLGDTIITFTGIDTSGNTSTDTMTVTIQDTTPPTITAPDDVIFSLGETVKIGHPNTYDIFHVIVTKNYAGSFPVGDTILVWTATDTSGNKSSDNQKISIVSLEKPLPVQIKSNPRDNSMILYWSIPEQVIDGYHIKYRTSTTYEQYHSDWIDTDGKYGTSISNGVHWSKITGLDNLQLYNFVVTPYNSMFTGDDSNIQSDIPNENEIKVWRTSTPLNFKVKSVGDGSVTLQWDKPLNEKGHPVADYKAQYSLDGTTWTKYNDGISTDTKMTITGLENGKTYKFHLVANNIAMDSFFTNVISATPHK